jgi:hypothetical protein
MPLLVLLSLPFLAAAAFAIAAALHYGAAAMRQAPDLPNLPMAMIGGAVAGGLAVLLALAAVQLVGAGPNCLPAGVILAGLAGEYLGGRVEDARSALVRGCLCALLLFPAGAALMAALLRQVS